LIQFVDACKKARRPVNRLPLRAQQRRWCWWHAGHTTRTRRVFVVAPVPDIGYPLNFDDHHLSNRGAAALAPMLAAVFQ
jgi:hypothetical protein